MRTEYAEFENPDKRSLYDTETILQLARERSHSERQAKMQLLSVQQVAKILSVSPAWVRDHATRKQPHLMNIKVGKLLKFRPNHVEEFINTCCR